MSRLLSLLLRLAPEEFRARYGEELIGVHEVRSGAPRGRGRAMAFKAREVLGMMRLVTRLRVESNRRESTGGGASMFDTSRQDVSFAWRTLTRNPGFALSAVMVLALGIGASTAIFSAANAFFFRPLPFADADRLVMIYETNPEFGWTDAQAAPANVLDWKEQVDAFEDIALYNDFMNQVTYLGGEEPELLTVSIVSGNFFDVLGVQPAVGRDFTWEESWAPNGAVVAISHALWVSHFGADPSVVGRVVEVSGNSVEVVGVMPEGFRFPDDRVQAWAPFNWPTENREAVFFRRAHGVRPIARLKPGVSFEQANAQLQVVVERLQAEYPETNSVMGAGFMPVRDFLIRGIRTQLVILLGAVLLLLLLACTNVANLLLVRANDRVREVALRFALGAERKRVVRQMLTESLVLGGLGGALGLALGWAGVRALTARETLGIEGATSVALDHRVVLFAVAAATLSGIVFGVAPALKTAGESVQTAMRDGGRGRSVGRRRINTAGVLVGAEVALALLLVIGAGLMVRSYMTMRAVDPGFRTQGSLAVQLTVPNSRYPNRAQVLGFWDSFTERLEGRPGIEMAGTVGQLPLSGSSWSSQFQAEGWPPERVGFEILHRRADAGYFEALQIPLIRGRLFGPTDGPDDPLVVVVNETFAEEHFAGEDPIGQKIAYDRQATPESNWYEIIGIVGDQHQNSPRESARAEVFENRDQDWGRTVWVVMETNVDPLSVVPAVREALAELDPLIPIASIRPLQDVWRASMSREQLILELLTVFGVVALLLAAVGVYGVTAQAARGRTREIGIRMALGAASRDVLGMILRQSVGVVTIGLAIGLGVALFLGRTLSSILYQVEPTDPLTLTSVVVLLGGVALVASYLPARRATTVDPTASLRTE